MADEERVDIDINEWKKLKVAELRNRVNDLGLDTKGTKAELIARVEKYLDEQDADLLEEEEEDMGGAEEEEMGGAEEEMGGGEDIGNDENIDSNKGTTNVLENQTTGNISSTEKVIKIEYQPPLVVNPSTIPPAAPVTKLTEQDKLKKRNERFGGDAMARKVARTERFGTTLTSQSVLGKRSGGEVSAESFEKMKARANRFGSAGGSKIIANLEDAEKRKDRATRFNLKPSDLTAEDRKQTRQERFGTSN